MLDMRSKANCRCPTCGTVISVEEVYLSPTQRRILDLVKRHGEIRPEVLWDAIWGSDPNGGPESRSTLMVHIVNLNKRIKPQGIAVRQRPRGWGMPYRLMQIAETAK